MTIRGAADRIKQTLLSWENIEAHPHRFGGTEYSIGKREIGHVHGDYLVDIPFPKKIRDEVIAAGEAEPHHILPETGWVSFYIRAEPDVERAIGLLRRSYEVALKQR
jgi:luciferase-like monooxygenase